MSDWQQHPDPDVQQAIMRLCNALCSFERSTGRQSLLIVRENNGEYPGNPMSAPGFCFRADCGRPLHNNQDDIPDAHLLEHVTYRKEPAHD